MIHYDEIPDVDRVCIRNHLVCIQYHLTMIALVGSARPLLDDLVNFKDFIDSQISISDDVPF